MAANVENLKKLQNDVQADNHEDFQEEDIFSTEEIKIEEMAIDGICGVY